MSGYTHCACHECFEVTIGEPGDYCEDCLAIGGIEVVADPGCPRDTVWLSGTTQDHDLLTPEGRALAAAGIVVRGLHVPRKQ
jgi:hypothetical protein